MSLLPTNKQLSNYIDLDDEETISRQDTAERSIFTLVKPLYAQLKLYVVGEVILKTPTIVALTASLGGEVVYGFRSNCGPSKEDREQCWEVAFLGLEGALTELANKVENIINI